MAQRSRTTRRSQAQRAARDLPVPTRAAKLSEATAQTPLSAAQLRHLARPRSGFTEFAPLVFAAVTEHADAVLVQGLDVEVMLAKLAQYKELAAEVRDKKLAYEMAEQALLQLGSEIWQGELLAYQHCKAAARTNPQVAAAIAPFEGFMKKGRKKRKPPTSTPAAA